MIVYVQEYFDIFGKTLICFVAELDEKIDTIFMFDSGIDLLISSSTSSTLCKKAINIHNSSYALFNHLGIIYLIHTIGSDYKSLIYQFTCLWSTRFTCSEQAQFVHTFLFTKSSASQWETDFFVKAAVWFEKGRNCCSRSVIVGQMRSIGRTTIDLTLMRNTDPSLQRWLIRELD